MYTLIKLSTCKSLQPQYRPKQTKRVAKVFAGKRKINYKINNLQKSIDSNTWLLFLWLCLSSVLKLPRAGAQGRQAAIAGMQVLICERARQKALSQSKHRSSAACVCSLGFRDSRDKFKIFCSASAVLLCRWLCDGILRKYVANASCSPISSHPPTHRQERKLYLYM